MRTRKNVLIACAVVLWASAVLVAVAGTSGRNVGLPVVLVAAAIAMTTAVARRR